MKHVLPFFLLMPYLLNAQNLHERTWFFGAGHYMQFLSGVGAPGGIPAPSSYDTYNLNGNLANASIAVSDSKGELQFFVQIRSMINSFGNQINLNYLYQ